MLIAVAKIFISSKLKTTQMNLNRIDKLSCINTI